MEKEKKPYLAMKSRRPTRKPNGTEVIYKLSEHPEKKPVAAAIAYFVSKFIYDDAFAAADNGPYTWVLKRRADTGALMLVAGKTRSQQELGTLHNNLVTHSPEGAIIAAGEFVKTGAEVLFNLQSGSYMQAVFTKIKSIQGKKAKREELIAEISDYLRAIGLNPTFNTAPAGASEEHEIAGLPMIDVMEIVSTLSEINEYKRLLSGNSSNA
jgi:hypothetical protein